MNKMKLCAAMTAGILLCTGLPVLAAEGDVTMSRITLLGDADNSENVSVSDVVKLSRFLLQRDNDISVNADLTADNRIDGFDLALLKAMLLGKYKPQDFTKLVINEVCASNKKSWSDADGREPDWLELYNGSGEAVDISGYGLADGKKNLFKYVFPEGTVIPAGGYLMVCCDDGLASTDASEHHVPFKLSASGETIYLTHPAYGTLDVLEVPAAETDISYGRCADGADVLSALTPTPNASNDTAERVAVVAAPQFSANGGFYDAEFELTLCADAGHEIYYTTDGSDPRTSDTAQKYTEGIRIYNNTDEPNVYSALTEITLITYNPPKNNVEKGIVIRAAAKNADGIFSPVEHNSYFVGKTASYFKEMKVISMVTDSDYLFDADNGMYMVGKEYYAWLDSPDYKKYDAADTRNPTNYNKDGRESEFPVSIQIIENGQAVYNADLGAKIAGNYTRVRPQKSLRLVTRSEYGDSSIKYPLFPDLTDAAGKVIDRYDKVTLWNGGNDFQFLHFRDALMQELAEGLNVDTMASEPCLLFIDGEFWGFYLLRERVDAEHLEAHYGLHQDEVAVIKNNALDDGTEEDLTAFKEFTTWAMNADMTDAQNYEKFCETVDVASFIDYMAVETYINNNDWASTGMNNWQVWRSKTVVPDVPQANGKWRFVLYDTDVSAGIYNNYKTMANYDSLANNMPVTKTYNFPAILKSLMKNDAFREQFHARYVYIIDNNFSKTRAIETLNAYVAAYETVTCDTYRRFGMGNEVVFYPQELQIITDFFNARPEYARSYLDAYCEANAK